MSENNFITPTSLHGIFKIDRPTFPDDRGFFRETIRVEDLEQITGYSFIIKQMNHSRSSKNTLRGIHVAPWNKMIYVTRGTVQAVIVDTRKDSPTFGKYESFIIGDLPAGRQGARSSIFIPKGCGNSYLVLSDEADYTYLTDEAWAPGREHGILWNDSDLAIKWELTGEPLLSEKDLQNPTFTSFNKE